MSPAEAKRIIQSIPTDQWIQHPTAGAGQCFALGIVNSPINDEVVEALGINIVRPPATDRGRDVAIPYMASGGPAWIFHAGTVNILAEAGANFSARSEFLTGKSKN